tara:strand:+ start:136 stop:1017 length:882 start_codon:yes stop_codon:yes gene_type:complete
MRTLIIGGSGKIGKIIKKKNDIFTFYKNKIKGGIKFNILKDDVNKLIDKFKINRIVLLSAISDPDECLKNKKLSNSLNVEKTKNIIDKIIKKNIYFVFFSSEYIFNGRKGNYDEKSSVNPTNLYGKQKYIIEKYIQKKTKNYCILRIAKTYGDQLDDKTLVSNFLINLIKGEKNFYIASDQKFNPLYVKDLKKIVNLFMYKKITGIFNIGGPIAISRYNCIKKVLSCFNYNIRKKVKINKISFKKVKTLDQLPLDVSLNIKKLKKILNFKMTNITDVAKKIILKYEIEKKIIN